MSYTDDLKQIAERLQDMGVGNERLTQIGLQVVELADAIDRQTDELGDRLQALSDVKKQNDDYDTLYADYRELELAYDRLLEDNTAQEVLIYCLSLLAAGEVQQAADDIQATLMHWGYFTPQVKIH